MVAAMTITAKVQIKPSPEQAQLLLDAGKAFASACNYTSDVVFETKNLIQAKLQKIVYGALRAEYCLPSQIT